MILFEWLLGTFPEVTLTPKEMEDYLNDTEKGSIIALLFHNKLW